MGRYRKMVLNAMIEAEEYESPANADMMKTSENPAIKRLVGAEGELELLLVLITRSLKLSKLVTTVRVIKEIYTRYFTRQRSKPIMDKRRNTLRSTQDNCWFISSINVFLFFINHILSHREF